MIKLHEIWAKITGQPFVWGELSQPERETFAEKHIDALVGGIATRFTCKCGKMEGWVADGEAKNDPCPSCGRKYKGVYNASKLTIEAVETSEDKPHE